MEKGAEPQSEVRQKVARKVTLINGQVKMWTGQLQECPDCGSNRCTHKEHTSSDPLAERCEQRLLLLPLHSLNQKDYWLLHC